jgi:hypothetical protein
VKLFQQSIARGMPALAALGLAIGFLAWAGLGSATAFASPAGRGNSGAVTDIDSVFVSANPLTTGCNQVTETTLPVGGKISDWVNANVQPASAVISVWHYDNPSQKYQAAYFNVPAVPVDVTTFPQAIDAFFICVGSSATAP